MRTRPSCGRTARKRIRHLDRYGAHWQAIHEATLCPAHHTAIGRVQVTTGHSPSSEIRIVKERIVYENAYGRLHDDEVLFMPQEHPGTYLRWSWRYPYSIAVMPLFADGRVLLIANYRHAARNVVTEVVKGFGTASEAPDVVARGELLQELGYDCETVELIGTVVTDPSFTAHPLHCYLALGCRQLSTAPESSESIVRAEEFNIHDAPTIIREGRVQDAVTIAMLWSAYHWLGDRDATQYHSTIPE
jgi:ADP-ribose pyrophosphatase